MKHKYIIVHSDSESTFVTLYDNLKQALDAVQASEIKDVRLYEIAREIPLREQPRIVVDEPLSLQG